MKVRFALSRVRGRGAGLGNELIPWARSYLAAQVLGAHMLKPSFGLNARKYWRHFGTPRYDWIINKCLEFFLPVVEFKEADYLQYGGGDFVDAFQKFAEVKNLHNRKCYMLITEGMWGGYKHIASARDFVLSVLMQSRFVVGNLAKIKQRLNHEKTIVGMHVRLGDFSPEVSNIGDYRGCFNKALPLSWYRNIAKSISDELKGNVQFLIVSDGNAEQLAQITEGLDIVTTFDIADSDCSDLIALAQADLLVCSVSSYSAWAAFLSNKPYIWFEPNLQKHREAFYSIWGHEAAQQQTGAETKTNLDKFTPMGVSIEGRGVPIDIGGVVKASDIRRLLNHEPNYAAETDLIQYGVVSCERNKLDEKCI